MNRFKPLNDKTWKKNVMKIDAYRKRFESIQTAQDED